MLSVSKQEYHRKRTQEPVRTNTFLQIKQSWPLWRGAASYLGHGLCRQSGSWVAALTHPPKLV